MRPGLRRSPPCTPSSRRSTWCPRDRAATRPSRGRPPYRRPDRSPSRAPSLVRAARIRSGDLGGARPVGPEVEGLRRPVTGRSEGGSMGDATGTTRAPIGAVIAIVGGALLAVGSFLSWAEGSGGGTSVSAKGVDGSDGYITLVAGIIAIGVGIAMTRRSKRAFAILAILAGLIGGGVGGYDG